MLLPPSCKAAARFSIIRSVTRWSGGSLLPPLPRAARDASILRSRLSSTSPIRTEVISADAASQFSEAMNVFLYVGSEKASLYRAIMRVFVESRERFSYHLRAEEV